MSYRITLYNGNPLMLKEEQGKQVMSAWASGVEKIILPDMAIASSNIAAIEKTDEEPDYLKIELPEKTNVNHDVLNGVRGFLKNKLSWR